MFQPASVSHHKAEARLSVKAETPWWPFFLSTITFVEAFELMQNRHSSFIFYLRFKGEVTIEKINILYSWTQRERNGWLDIFFSCTIEVKFREGKHFGINLKWMGVCLPWHGLCLSWFFLSVTNSFLPCILLFSIF